MLWINSVLNNPQIEISTFCDQPDVTSSLNQKQKAFITSRNLSIGITWIFENKFILNQYQNHFCDWHNFEVPKILHENISLYKKPKLTFTYPHPKLNPSWTLGGHDQAGGQSKTHGRAGSMIPVLRKMTGKIGNSTCWGEGQRCMMTSNPSQRSRSQYVTRVSKSGKAIKVYYQHYNFWEKTKTPWRNGGLYFSGKYTCISIIMHFLATFTYQCFNIIPWVVRFLTLPPFECAFEP